MRSLSKSQEDSREGIVKIIPGSGGGRVTIDV